MGPRPRPSEQRIVPAPLRAPSLLSQDPKLDPWSQAYLVALDPVVTLPDQDDVQHIAAPYTQSPSSAHTDVPVVPGRGRERNGIHFIRDRPGCEGVALQRCVAVSSRTSSSRYLCTGWAAVLEGDEQWYAVRKVVLQRIVEG